MYLHGILHRVEGDYDNARAEYGDVNASLGHGRGRLEGVEREGSVIEHSKNKFGTGRWEDESSAWVKHYLKIRRMSEDQVGEPRLKRILGTNNQEERTSIKTNPLTSDR